MADAPPEAAKALSNPAARVGRYVPFAELGRGGMGVVYRAWDPDLERVVAVKLLLDTESDEATKRFLREATAAGKLRHPGIVMVLDTGTHDGKPFLVMDLIEGESFFSLLKREKKLAPREIARIVRGVALAVAQAHLAGIVHRDLKPGNILLDQEGEPHLADFGLVRIIGAKSLTQSGMALGTPGYMAPEQAAGERQKQGPPSDVYALGAILYRALAGQTAFHGLGPAQVLFATPADPKTLNPEADTALCALALACMVKEPKHRPTATEVAAQLGRYLERSRGGGLKKSVAAVALVGLGAALAVAGLAFRPAPAPPSKTAAVAAPPPPAPPAAPPPTPPAPVVERPLAFESAFLIGVTGRLQPTGVSPSLGTDERSRGSALALDAKGHRLFVALTDESRIFVYRLTNDNALKEDDPIAVLGQSDREATQPGPLRIGFDVIGAIAYDDRRGYLAVTDRNRNRILLLDVREPKDGLRPIYVLGKAHPDLSVDWEDYAPLYGGGGFKDPCGVASDGESLYCSAAEHDRVSVFDWSDVEGGIRNGRHVVARHQLGRQQLVIPPTPKPPIILSASSLEGPTSVALGLGWLFVSDVRNERVLGYSLPIDDNARPATTVLGQRDLGPVHARRDPGDAASRMNLGGPAELAVDPVRKRLYVSSERYRRVLAFELDEKLARPPVQPSFVLGQSDFESKGEETAADLLSSPRSLAVDAESGRLFVGDGRTGALVTFVPTRR